MKLSTLTLLLLSAAPVARAMASNRDMKTPALRRMLQEDEDDLEDPEIGEPDDEEDEIASISGDETASISGDEDESSTRSIIGVPTERECEWTIKDSKVEFECKSKEETDVIEIKDKIKFKVGAKGEGALKVKVEYEHESENETTDMEMETETSYEIVFDKIVEYRKNPDTIALTRSSTAGSQAYDWEQDTIVQEWAMTEWEDFSAVTDDGPLSTFSVHTPDGIASFFFTIARSDAGDVTANKMKIDFELTGFPWQAQDTYVALLCSVESIQEVDVEYDDVDEEDETAVEVGSPVVARETKDVRISFEEATEVVSIVPFGEYTWKTEATANTTEAIEVVATSPVTNATIANQIAFSFVGGAAQSAGDIYWDPSAGVGYKSGAWSFGLASSLVAVGAAITALMF